MVKTAILSKIGLAEEVVSIESISQADFDDSSILVKMQFSPINPADILMIEGNYASVPSCPTEIGIEGSGIIEEVGNRITNFKVGDKVMCLSRTNWKTTQILKENEVIKLPESIDLQQAAMLKVNLASAYLMLTNFRKLSNGNWIIQNASNSAVGKNIIYLSKSLGLKTINLVRRDNVIDELLDIGADIVINSDDINVIKKELHSKVDGPISLGIDAVAGDAIDGVKRAEHFACRINHDLPRFGRHGGVGWHSVHFDPSVAVEDSRNGSRRGWQGGGGGGWWQQQRCQQQQQQPQQADARRADRRL